MDASIKGVMHQSSCCSFQGIVAAVKREAKTLYESTGFKGEGVRDLLHRSVGVGRV